MLPELPLGELLRQVRQRAPLIHSIMNYVTANDCANVLLACGASPVMASSPEEAAEMTAASDGLYLNLGTLSAGAVAAMLAAGSRARDLGRPVLLDPVGVGASRFRREAVRFLLESVPLAAIRGNLSEIKVLAAHACTEKGVDASEADRITEENFSAVAALAGELARRTGAVIAVTGAMDVVCDGLRTVCVRNGHPMMSRITGTGCQLSAVMTAFLAANRDCPLEAAVAAVCAVGLCGQTAYARLTGPEGTGAFRMYLLDAVSRLTPEELERGAQYEVQS